MATNTKMLELTFNVEGGRSMILSIPSPNHHALRRHCERKRISAIIRVETTT